MSSRTALVGLTVALASCGPTTVKAPRTRMTIKQIVEKSKPAIVRIEADKERVGTGFAIDPQGVIATNLHVVAGAHDIQVRLLDGAVYPVKQILGVDLDRDLALLDIDPPSPMPSLPLGDSEQVSAGDPVIAIGNPLGVLDYTVSDGLISSVRAVSDDLTILQISAPISQGSSGGPLFNPFGEVIGVSTAIFTGGQNLNFGVPSKYIKALVDAPHPMTIDEFAKATSIEHDPHAAPNPDTPIVRAVPVHDVTVLDGCDQAQMAAIAQGISEAISVGAPLYNDGNHEACYRVYEGTALRLERDAACAGVRTAFGDGLTRAGTMATWKEKAWALRDAFDGMLDVILRRARAEGMAPQP
ncbi:MAG: serine protease [Kofleriaceae bacterium]|nr:serine protease [Kofleriaceae bacterium]